MSKIVMLDNGHGGTINGKYQTSGKRSPNYHNGVLYEGVFNRWVVNRLKERLDRFKIPYYTLCPEDRDMSLEVRAGRANDIYDSNPDTYVLSIHANAGGGTGIEGFTTRGETMSDDIAELFLSNLEEDFPEQRMRFDKSDGDKDKEVDFYILRKVKSPAFLLECGFMDNLEDYDNLWDENYLSRLVDSIFKTILKLYNDKY